MIPTNLAEKVGQTLDFRGQRLGESLNVHRIVCECSGEYPNHHFGGPGWVDGVYLFSHRFADGSGLVWTDDENMAKHTMVCWRADANMNKSLSGALGYLAERVRSFGGYQSRDEKFRFNREEDVVVEEKE